MNEPWVFEHSLECPVTREFAWSFWTNVSNWKLDADVESVELYGPFAAGSHGVTVTRSSGPIKWHLTSVDPETSAVFEIPLRGATLQFSWTFEDLATRARLTQRASIAGESALPVIEAIAPSLEGGIPTGMQKLCDAMASAATGSR